MKLVRTILTLNCLTMLSRFFGFARDILIASVLGAGPVADAFWLAFRLPNLLRRLFAEGAFNSAFVPAFAKDLEMEGQEKACENASHVLSALTIILISLVIAVLIFTPVLMYIYAPGLFHTPERYGITLEFIRIMFPYILFISVAGLFTGILNCYGKFATGAAAPIALNVIMIIAISTYSYWSSTPGYPLAWSVFIAGLVQVLIVWAHLKYMKIPIKFAWPKLSPPVRRVIKLMLPSAIAAGVIQINLVIGTMFLSFAPVGAISYWNYADRLVQLPLSLIGVAVSTALLPAISMHVARNEAEIAQKTQNRALEFSFFFAFPAAVALYVLSEPIITVLFRRMAFGELQVIETAKVLAAFSLSLPAYVMVKIYSTAFFARYDTKTPLNGAILAVGANVILNFMVVGSYSYVGIAYATSLAAWLNAFFMMYMALRKDIHILDERLKRNLPRIIGASAFMGLTLYFSSGYFYEQIESTEFIRAITLMFLIILGSVAYISFASVVKVIDFQEIKGLLRPKLAYKQKK